MKKNKIFSLLAAASLLISVPSCTNLDERIYDQLPAETFGSTATEINHWWVPATTRSNACSLLMV